MTLASMLRGRKAIQFQIVSLMAACAVVGFAHPLQAEVIRRTMLPGRDSLLIEDRPMVRGSESVVQGTDTLSAELDYTISSDGQWLVLDRVYKDTVLVEYIRLSGLSVASRRFAPLDRSVMPESQDPALGALTSSPVSEGRFDIAGSKKLSFGVGRGGGLVEQSLYLSIQGKIGPRLTIEGTISDRGTATQTITRRPSEFEKISLRAYGPGFDSEFGDTELKQDDFRLFGMRRRLSGLRASGTAGSLYGGALMGERRGQFRTLQLYGVDGKQGPYFLGTGNRVAVVPGSESVWIDGELLSSGVEQDYEIDYPTGVLTFSASRPVSRELRISIDYEVAADAYPSFVYQAGAGVRRNGWDLAWLVHREWDDAEHPRLYTLTDADRSALELAGDSAALAVRTGIDSVGPGNGTYIRDSLSGEFLYAGPGSGEFNLTFSFLGPGGGGYRAIGDGSFFFVGDSLGDYAPVVALPLPSESKMVAVRASHTRGAHAVRFEWAQSENDPNRLSSLGNNVHTGAAWLGSYDWDEADRLVGAGVVFRHREARFAAQGRDVDVEYSRIWGDAQGAVPGDEDEFGAHVRLGSDVRGARIEVTRRTTADEEQSLRTAGLANLDLFGHWVGNFQTVRRDHTIDLQYDQAALKWSLPARRIPFTLGLSGERRVEQEGYRFVEMQGSVGESALRLQGTVRRTDSLVSFWQRHNDLYTATGEWQHHGSGLAGGLTLHYQYRSFTNFQTGTDDRVLAESRWTWRHRGWSVRVEHRLSRTQALASNEEYVPVGSGRGDYREENGQIIPDPLGDLIRVIRPLSFGALARQSEKRAHVSWYGRSLRGEIDLVTIETADNAELPGVAWLAPWTVDGGPTQRRVLRTDVSGGRRGLRWVWSSEWTRRRDIQSTRPQDFEKLATRARIRFPVTSVLTAEFKSGVGVERERVLFPYDFRFLSVGFSPAWRPGENAELTLPIFAQRYWMPGGNVLADWQKVGLRFVLRPGYQSRIVVEPTLNHIRSFVSSLPLAVGSGRPRGTSAEWRVEGAMDLSGSVVGRLLYRGRSQPDREPVHRADLTVEATF